MPSFRRLIQQSTQAGFGRHLHTNRYRIAFTYSLAIAASLVALLYPLLIGAAIDGILAHNNTPLITLMAIWFAHLFVDYFRQLYDTNTFARIEAGFIAEMVVAQRTASKETSVVAARSQMVKDICGYFAYQVPSMLMSLIGPLGALVTLWLLDWQLGLAGTVYCLIAISVISTIYPRSLALFADLNNRNEKNTSVIDNANEAEVSQHFHEVATATIKVSNFEATIDVVAEVLRIVFSVVFLLRLGQIDNVTPGAAYALVNYGWRLTDGVNFMPVLTQQFARIRDIYRRISIDLNG